MAKPTLEHRSKEQQIPAGNDDLSLIRTIYGHFKDDPFKFEHCAAEIARMMDPNITTYELTRPWRDGGRDAIGNYRIGPIGSGIEVEFALEAKCYSLDNSVGVKETSRLISRLKHRQFGILVTTSYVHSQAYKEIKEDGHPVVIISARDICGILRGKGISNAADAKAWLDKGF